MPLRSTLRPRLRLHGETLFNLLGTHIPSHGLRQAWLRACGASIGEGTAIFRGTTVLGTEQLRIGSHTAIGFRCMLDARGGITIGDHVVIASDVHLITADHDPRSVDFDVRVAPIVVGDRAWLASRCTVLLGAEIGPGAAVAAAGVVRADVDPLTIVGGVPAREIGRRPDGLRYKVGFRPRFY